MATVWRIPGHTEALSDRIQTSGAWFEPPTEHNLTRFNHEQVEIAVKDGRIFGGRNFYAYRGSDTIRLERDNYLGGGWAVIPIDEIVGIRSAWAGVGA